MIAAPLLARAVEGGDHPLSVALRRPIPLHVEAPSVVDRHDPGPRCGTCVYRAPRRDDAGRPRPKCTQHDDGVGLVVTDVPAWWPGCTDHERSGP